MREKGYSIGNEDLRFILDGLVNANAVSYRKEGQKYLYGYQSDFFANDVKVWNPGE